MGALEGEVRLIRERMTGVTPETRGPFSIYRGRFLDRPAVLALTGTGKVLAAALTQYLIDRDDPRGILFTGIAGSLNPLYGPGDLILARDCVQYDLDVSALGVPAGKVPGTEYRFLPAHGPYLEAARGFVPPAGTLHVGRILTGDRFVTRKNRSTVPAELEGDAVEMEGAAAALTARIAGVPFLLVRTVSDGADGKPPGGLRAVLETASRQHLAFLEYLVPRLD